ncbi:MAG: nucleotidyltransferase family protein [Acidobacteriota bacterium]
MNKVYGWKPTYEQELVLKAALLSETDSLDHWKQLTKEFDITKLDGGSNRLLPLVGENLKAPLSENERYYQLIRGTKKKCWYKNNLLLKTALNVFEKFKEEGIDFTVLKGLHLNSAYYKNLSLRPMNDIDFLVSWGQAERVGNILFDNGWEYLYHVKYPVFSKNSMSMVKSMGFRDKSGYSLDLHWNLLNHRCFPGADRYFLNRRISLEIAGENFMALCPEDLILFLLEHSAYFSNAPSIRWVADLVVVLRKEKNLDWDIIIDNITRFNLEVPVLVMLEYLLNEFGINEVLLPVRKIRELPVSEKSKKLYKNMLPSNTHIGNRSKAYLKFLDRYKTYLKEHEKKEEPSGLSGYVKFLMSRWGISNLFLFMIIFPGKLVDKIFRYLFLNRFSQH